MSAYCTLADLINAIGENAVLELTDIDNDGAADPVVYNKAIKDASAHVDGFCRRLHSAQLPFNPIPELINSLVTDETVYLLKFRRRLTTDIDVQGRADRQDTLERIEQGRIMPVDGDLYPPGSSDGPPVVEERSSTDGTVSRASLKGWGFFG